jgi:hypothetical protein
MGETTMSARVKKKVLVSLLISLLLGCCLMFQYLSPVGCIPQTGWHTVEGPLGTKVRIKDSWSLSASDNGRGSQIVDADGEILFKGIVYNGYLRNNSVEHVLREFPEYEFVKETYKGSDDLHSLWEIEYRDTVTDEVSTMQVIEHFDTEPKPESRSRDIMTFYSVSDRIGWYEARMMTELPFFFS